jgi:protease-4
VATQGDVAASAGYWITLEADHVYTTPLTVTGSIGVISGWVWDAGVGEKTGFSADGVQRGKHADLYTGTRFPGIGERLPGRPLTEEERERARSLIVGMYDEFVGLVAESRDLPEEEVREIAGGRVWMGSDAVRLGLCDGMGTLLDAVEDAAVRAGLDPADVRVEEFPARKRFRLPKLFPSLPSFGVAGPGGVAEAFGYEIEFLRGIARHAGEPQLLVSPTALPDAWRDAE